jgi:hypothetical protein
MVEITVINKADKSPFPSEFQQVMNDLSVNPFVVKDNKNSRYAELYLVSMYDEYVFPSTVIWGDRTKFLIITELKEISKIGNSLLDKERTRKENKLKPNWDIYFFEARVFSQNDMINLSMSLAKMRKIFESRIDQTSATKDAELQYAIDGEKKRADEYKQRWESWQNKLDDFMEEQMAERLKREKRLINTVTRMAQGDNLFAVEESVKIEDKDEIGADDSE